MISCCSQERSSWKIVLNIFFYHDCWLPFCWAQVFHFDLFKSLNWLHFWPRSFEDHMRDNMFRFIWPKFYCSCKIFRIRNYSFHNSRNCIFRKTSTTKVSRMVGTEMSAFPQSISFTFTTWLRKRAEWWLYSRIVSRDFRKKYLPFEK